MFKSAPKGTISRRKLKRIYPYLIHKDLPNTILEFTWNMLNTLVPLVITPYFPRALGIMWQALKDIEELHEMDVNEANYEEEIAFMIDALYKDEVNKVVEEN